jgi:hypothetical protein
MSMFETTHTVPPAGMSTWPAPDAAQPQGPPLAADLPVHVVEWWGDWAKVECTNGWTTWVDGRHLVPAGGPPAPMAASTAMPTASVDPTLDTSPLKVGGVQLSVPLVGAVAVAISAFLPWLSSGGVSTGSMDVPVGFLLDYKTADTGGLKVGWVLLALSALALVLALRPEVAPPVARRAVGWALVVIPSVFVAQLQRLTGDLQAGSVFSLVGFGVYVALVGGLLIAMGKVPGQAASG